MQILELNHTALHVANVEVSSTFYSTVLRLPPLQRPAFDFPGAWFRLGQQQELHLIGNRDQPVHSSNRGTHFALKVDDLNAWKLHLEQQGAKFKGPKQRPDGAWQIFVEDPDGHIVELFTPPS
jgi:catechol 2,3-dioxygenase-like lactoylglutathione lyase family enzyme